MKLVPEPPLIVTVTDEELAALQRCRGGYSTHSGTADDELFQRLEDRGMVKAVTMNGDGETFWKLSSDGLTLAYGDDAPFEHVGKDHPLPG